MKPPPPESALSVLIGNQQTQALAVAFPFHAQKKATALDAIDNRMGRLVPPAPRAGNDTNAWRIRSLPIVNPCLSSVRLYLTLIPV